MSTLVLETNDDLNKKFKILWQSVRHLPVSSSWTSFTKMIDSTIISVSYCKATDVTAIQFKNEEDKTMFFLRWS